MTKRTAAAWQSFEDFRGFHRPHLPWYFTDPATGTSYKLRFDRLDYEVERGTNENYDDNSFNCLARQYSGAV